MAPKRKGLSKRTRFEVFKRDGFRCVYCGANPNDGPLHVDHVQPIAVGGADDEMNMVTACASCNGGKSDVPLDRRAFQPTDPETAKEHAEQIRAWLAAQRQVFDAKRDTDQAIVNMWCEAMGTKICDRDVIPRLRKILGEWGPEKTCEALDIVSWKGLSGDTNRLQYMYGVLRKWREDAMPTDAEWAAMHPAPTALDDLLAHGGAIG